jgi:hypothetical protein
MVDAKRRDQWNHTATLWALIANCHRDSKQQAEPFKPSDIHPFAEHEVPEPEVIAWLQKREFIMGLSDEKREQYIGELYGRQPSN